MKSIELRSINDIFFCDEISQDSHKILSDVWKHLDSNDFYIERIVISADRMYANIEFDKKRWHVQYRISLLIMSEMNRNGMQSTLEHMKADILNYWEKSYADNQRITQVPN
jgi:hypothetical protein